MSRLFRLVALVTLLAAGCGSEHGDAGVPVPETGPISGTPLTSVKPTTAPGGACTTPDSVRITAGGVPDPVCVAVNGSLRLSSDPSPHQPWGQLVSSDPKILSCASESGPQGTVSGVCAPHLPGTVTVSTMTAPFAGDPSGPPQFRWELRVTVVAYGMN